jgi:adenine deaminase
LGFVKGFGFKKGATASTIAHDSHNLLVIGLNDEDMAFATNNLIETRGGIIVVNNRKILGLVDLPIAGLMSEKSMDEVYKETKQLEGAWKEIGCKMASPFPALILLSLPVLPALRITDKGLIDTIKFKKLSLIVQ